MTTGRTPEAPPAQPRRSHARSNRVRLLAAAREELGRDPDASLDEIARAAGVVWALRWLTSEPQGVIDDDRAHA